MWCQNIFVFHNNTIIYIYIHIATRVPDMLQYKRLLETWVNIQNPDDFTFTLRSERGNSKTHTTKLLFGHQIWFAGKSSLVGGLEHFFLSIPLERIIPTDELIFFRWLVIPPSSSILYDFPSQKPSCMYWMFPWFCHDFAMIFPCPPGKVLSAQVMSQLDAGSGALRVRRWRIQGEHCIYMHLHACRHTKRCGKPWRPIIEVDS